MAIRPEALHISRRNLLIGGGAGVGLLLAWAVWPRSYPDDLRAAEGETILNSFLKIGSDGRVIVAVPQAELGQGVYTSLPQILADELGADWRTVSVEPSPISPVYANRFLAGELAHERLPEMLREVGTWAAQEHATRTGLMLTGGSTSIRAFEQSFREAGAAARALLSKAAAKQWDVDWESLDTRGGFVLNGEQKISFADLAAEASSYKVPDELPFRVGNEDRLVGESLPRLDLPSKVDGSAQFAGDVRLPGMVYGSVRQGPLGKSRLVGVRSAAAKRIPGVIAVIENPRWAGAVATNWWAANRAIEVMMPRFQTEGRFAESADLDRQLLAAVGEGGTRMFGSGDADEALASGTVIRANYAVDAVANAPPETLTATARVADGRVEVWAPAQAPGFARAAAARAARVPETQVTIYRSLIGGGYGRKLETMAIEQAVTMAIEVGKPVQLVWSRIEETMQDSFRPPAYAQMAARVEQGGSIVAWHARIAAPSTLAEVRGRLARGKPGPNGQSEAAAVEGAVPPYGIASVAVDHHPAAVGIPTGLWRSRAHSYTAFFTECFIDEIARQALIEPLSFRMRMLGSNPRLARALTTAAALGGWDGGARGSAMGLAVHSAFGSHAALVVEIEAAPDIGFKVTRAICAVDCGRVINPEIVRQQVEGAIITGIAGATGGRIRFERGLPSARSFAHLRLPILATSPEVIVEIVPSEAEPGGVTELGVPAVAPAIANAVFALTGRRLRRLPLRIGANA